MLTKKELHNLAKATVDAFEEYGPDGVFSDELDLAKGYLALETQLRRLKRVHGVIARVARRV
jgi:hypothetical protein